MKRSLNRTFLIEDAITQLVGRVSMLSRNGLQLAWYDDWHPALAQALVTLPEMDACPHELYGKLLQNPGHSRKRTALVTEKGIPVAVVGLKQQGHHWEPVTQWLLPGAVFPVKPGYLTRVLEALPVDVWVAWWRMGGPPPQSRSIRHLESMPTHGFDLSRNPEDYWRDTGQFKTIRSKRNRCRHFTLSVDSPGSAEWTTRGWEAKWRVSGAAEMPDLADRLLAARYLESCGRHYTLLLSDQGSPIAGATLIVHDRTLVAGVSYREPEYDWYGVGTALIDSVFCWAAESGYEALDIGGDQDYKGGWAPQNGHRWHFDVCPDLLFVAKRVARALMRNGDANG